MPSERTRTLGNGQHTVICLHGWFGSGGDWGPWEQFLDRETFTWVFPDYRGYGERIHEDGKFDLDEVSADLVSVLEEFESSSSVSVLGHSMGGVFAQHLLTKIGDRISAFIGLSPVPSSGSPLPPEQRQLFESAEFEIGARKTIIDITTGQKLSGRWLDAMAEANRMTSTDRAIGRYFRTWADCNFLDELGEQSIPALVIVGENDPAVTLDMVQASYGHTFVDIMVVEYAGAGHYSMFEAPLRLASDIEEFLRGVLEMD